MNFHKVTIERAANGYILTFEDEGAELKFIAKNKVAILEILDVEAEFPEIVPPADSEDFENDLTKEESD